MAIRTVIKVSLEDILFAVLGLFNEVLSNLREIEITSTRRGEGGGGSLDYQTLIIQLMATRSVVVVSI